ncbi:uncharacterized protein [Vulpes vulpes]|uniref:Translation initiation factor IF-2-like n=1 Tax=Vulpes vulpes TaxID=9627 RepID=A0ABM4YLU1_VULVU
MLPMQTWRKYVPNCAFLILVPLPVRSPHRSQAPAALSAASLPGVWCSPASGQGQRRRRGLRGPERGLAGKAESALLGRGLFGVSQPREGRKEALARSPWPPRRGPSPPARSPRPRAAPAPYLRVSDLRAAAIPAASPGAASRRGCVPRRPRTEPWALPGKGAGSIHLHSEFILWHRNLQGIKLLLKVIYQASLCHIDLVVAQSIAGGFSGRVANLEVSISLQDFRELAMAFWFRGMISPKLPSQWFFF